MFSKSPLASSRFAFSEYHLAIVSIGRWNNLDRENFTSLIRRRRFSRDIYPDCTLSMSLSKVSSHPKRFSPWMSLPPVACVRWNR